MAAYPSGWWGIWEDGYWYAGSGRWVEDPRYAARFGSAAYAAEAMVGLPGHPEPRAF